MNLPHRLQALIGTAVLCAGVAQAAGMTPYAYVELSKQDIDADIVAFRQLIGTVSGFQGNPDAWLAQEALLQERFDADSEALCERFGVTCQDYLLFYSENRDDIDAYLEAHPEAQSELDALAAQRRALGEQYEAMRASLVPVAPAPEPATGAPPA